MASPTTSVLYYESDNYSNRRYLDRSRQVHNSAPHGGRNRAESRETKRELFFGLGF